MIRDSRIQRNSCDIQTSSLSQHDLDVTKDHRSPSEEPSRNCHPATVSLKRKLAGDLAVAGGVSFLIAPFLSIVDKAVVESAAGNRSLIQSGLESSRGILRAPLSYIKSPSFLLMWGVYTATYGAANSLKTITEHKFEPPKHRLTTTVRRDMKDGSIAADESGIGKMGVFLGTTFVNSTASLLKDRAFAKMFGTNSASGGVPKMTYAFWIARDFSVIGSTFVLPDLVSDYASKHWDVDQKTAMTISQVGLPMVTQFVAGPLHYLGLDCYNRDLSTKSFSGAVADRSRSLLHGAMPVTMAKIARIVPTYSVGGVFNTNFRDQWREYLVQQEERNGHQQLASNAFDPQSILFRKQISSA